MALGNPWLNRLIPGVSWSRCTLSGQGPQGPALVFTAACGPPAQSRVSGRERPHLRAQAPRGTPSPGTGPGSQGCWPCRAGQPPASEPKTSQPILKVRPARKTSLSGQSHRCRNFVFLLLLIFFISIYGFGHALAERLRILSRGT